MFCPMVDFLLSEFLTYNGTYEHKPGDKNTQTLKQHCNVRDDEDVNIVQS